MIEIYSLSCIYIKLCHRRRRRRETSFLCEGYLALVIYI